MDREIAAGLVSENLQALFAFSLSRLYDKGAAEDLTHDIVCEVLRSVHRLEDDGAFSAFMWRIADNTFKKHLRKQKQNVAFDEQFAGSYWDFPLEKLEAEQDIFVLRRELSLLSRQYREVTVAHYIYGKSCACIAAELAISVEMVKYYLYKTRKQLKEGFVMTRELGEKSYNPGVFRMDAWTNGPNACYWKLFDQRKLPGSIVLAAYTAPLTMRELSVELGVSMPYLEDEVDRLLEHEMLIKVGDKIQTNIMIFPQACENEVAELSRVACARVAQQIAPALTAALPKLRELDFHGNDYSDNRLLWTLANLAMLYGLEWADDTLRGRFGAYPLLSNGAHGFIYGFDYDRDDHLFNGIYGHCDAAPEPTYFTVVNYRIIEACQRWQPMNWDKSCAAMVAAMLKKTADPNNDMLVRLIKEGFIHSHDGQLSAAFPVFTLDMVQNTVFDLLASLPRIIEDCQLEVCEKAAELLKRHTPKHLHSKCAQLAAIHYQKNVLAQIVEALVAQGTLVVPDANEKLCVHGVLL